MSGGTKTTKQESAPWAAAQPALNAALGGAQNLYDSNSLFTPYTGSLVTPFSGDTLSGFDALRGNANGAIASGSMQQPMDFLGGVFGSGGLSADQQGVADQWRNTASGAELGTTSPAFNDLLRRVQDSTRTGVDLSMSANGRYGSGQHTGTLADALGGVTGQMLDTEYGRQLQRQDAARSSLAGLGQQGMANQFGATAALPGAYDAAGQPARDLMGIGSAQEAKSAQTLMDEFRKWQEQTGQQQKATEWLSGIAGGMGGLGGTTTMTQPAPSPLMQLLGAGLGISSLFGNPFGAPMATGMLY